MIFVQRPQPEEHHDISKTRNFHTELIERLLKRSAKKPPAMENKMNGSENSALIDSPKRCYSTEDTLVPKMHKDDELFQHIVAERALELRDDERPEPERRR